MAKQNKIHNKYHFLSQSSSSLLFFNLIKWSFEEFFRNLYKACEVKTNVLGQTQVKLSLSTLFRYESTLEWVYTLDV